MSAARPAALALLLLAGCVPPRPEAPRARDWAAAAAAYERLLRDDPESALLRYDLGSALVLARRYGEAMGNLQAATRTRDLRLRERAFYNLGNAYLEPGFGSAQRHGGQVLLRSAIEAYESALLLDPDDFDAKWNLELARSLLAKEPPQSGGGGGGGGGSAAQSENPRPQPAGGEGGDEEMSRGEAERILSAAQQRELGVQREKLRRPQPPNPSAH